MKQLFAILAFFLLATQPATPAELTAFAPFLGTWAGTGQLWGKPATIQLQWKRTLADKFVSLDFEVIDKASGSAMFAGQAMYPAGQGTWHDSNGAIYSISWKADGDSIVAEWGPAGAPMGKSLYRLRPGGEAEITDFIGNKDGSWREFARYVARRRL